MHIITDLRTGGAEMALCRLLETSSGTHRVISLISGGALVPRLAARGIPVDDVGMRQGRPALGAALSVARAIRRARPDLLMGWMYHGNIAATLARPATTPRLAPLVWGIRHSLHDMTVEKPLTQRLIGLGARLSRFVARIVYCSEVSARQHEALGYHRARTVIIPNGIDCDLFRPRPEARERLGHDLGIARATTIIGMVAGWRPMKDHGNLLQAARRLIERGMEIHLVLVGPDVDARNAQLAAQIEALGLGPSVTLLGERSDLPEIMAGLDLLVVPSAWGEAFSNVLCEAMASGVPCVATDVGDSALIVGDTAMIVPPRDVGALEARIAPMVKEPAARRRMGELARARVVQRWPLQEMARRYDELYEEVSASRARRRAAPT